MAAKLLHSLADDNPDLQKQNGSMTRIFQVLDRQHLLSERHTEQRRIMPPPSRGTSKFSNGCLDADSCNAYNGEAMERNPNKYVDERLRALTESSTPSFSRFLYSSSFSSRDYATTGQPGPSSMDRVIFVETSSRAPVLSQMNASPRTRRLSVDLRDVVKESMYKDPRGISGQTNIKDDVSSHTLKPKDSPRHLHFSKSGNEFEGVRMTRAQEVPTDIKDSLRALVKLHEAPLYYHNEKEIPVVSYELKDGSCFSMTRNAPTFSYDGREVNRKIKDVPRLSLDSRESSARSSIVDSKFSHLSENVQRICEYPDETVGNLAQLSTGQPRPSRVVAKLMGLDMIPGSRSSREVHMDPIKIIPTEDRNLPAVINSRLPDVCKPVHLQKSPRRFRKEATSLQWKNVDVIMKPSSSSKFPIEPAPWKHCNGGRCSPNQASSMVRPSASSVGNSTLVYEEIQKRLKDVEFKQCGKDLRDLEEVVEVMLAEEPVETTNEQLLSSENVRNDGQRFGCDTLTGMTFSNSRISRSKLKPSSSSNASQSSIVIMKPAKLVKKSSIVAPSITPVHGLPALRRPKSGDSSAQLKNSASSKMTKDHAVRDSCKNQATTSIDGRANNRNLRVAQTSSRLQPVSKDNSTNSMKNAGSISPRLPQKKLDSDKKSCQPSPSSDLSKTQKLASRVSTESGSPRRRRRPITRSLQHNDNNLSENCNEPRKLICEEDSKSVKKTVDIEFTGNEQPEEEVCNESQSLEAFKHLISEETENDMKLRLLEEDAAGVLSTASEQPSPVSVLDSSAYMEDSPSPLRQDDPITESNESPGEELWNTIDDLSLPNTVLGPPSKINHKKLQSIDILVQKLRRLNSTHDESQTDYIASLCEKANPDDRYISEILLTSGLLLRDLVSGLATFQLHPSGHPINPELFTVLEHKKASSMLAKRENNAEKLHRKLIFDVVNEILAPKLNSVTQPAEPWLKPDKLAKKTLNAKMLLNELSTEIELLQAKKPDFSQEQGVDEWKNILWDDVIKRSDQWTDFRSDLSRIVLDVERSIFRDLINEIVNSEATALRAGPNRRSRQLFSN